MGSRQPTVAAREPVISSSKKPEQMFLGKEIAESSMGVVLKIVFIADSFYLARLVHG